MLDPDRRLAASREHVLSWPAEKVPMAHGTTVSEDGRAFLSYDDTALNSRARSAISRVSILHVPARNVHLVRTARSGAIARIAVETIALAGG